MYKTFVSELAFSENMFELKLFEIAAKRSIYSEVLRIKINYLNDFRLGDGGWSEWNLAINCSVECGNGTKTHVRNCTNPVPLGNGKQCQLEKKVYNFTMYGLTEKKEEPCYAGECPVG